MLKISITSDSDQGTRLQVEGRLVGPWVDELRRLSDELQSRSKALTLDLERLVYADQGGVALLRDLSLKKVIQLNCSPFIQQQLREVAPC